MSNNKDINWSSKRRDSSRTLAYYFDAQGRDWRSLREAVTEISAELGLSTAGKRRSEIAVECHEMLLKSGWAPPANYVPPWLRGNGHVIVRGTVKAAIQDRIVAFYDSLDWRKLSYSVLRDRGRVCECCGATPPAVVVHVDHIKSLKKHWELRLEQSNLQVLCKDCNRGKGSHDQTDWRTKESGPAGLNRMAGSGSPLPSRL